MSIFNFFKKNNDNETSVMLEEKQKIEPVLSPTYSFSEGEIVNISDKLIDTEDDVAIAKFKHNLNVLNKQITLDGVKPKFYIIREDDEIPRNWQWEVSSLDTKLEDTSLLLSYEIRKKLALDKYKEILIGEGKRYFFDDEKFRTILSGIDPNVGCVKLPSHFRSTKHFTINTPLENTGDYNMVKVERNFIVLDNMTNFINSGYGYSVSCHDAYLDVSHEGTPISKDAIVLIREDKYQKLIKDVSLFKQLADRKVILYKGDTAVAINMLLSQLGALSFRVGYAYLEYDEKRNNIMNDSLKQIAHENGMLYDKSHGGLFLPSGGHFTNYYDDMNKDYTNSLIGFYKYFLQAFPDCNLSLLDLEQNNEMKIKKFLDQTDVNDVLEVIGKYNIWAEKQFLKRYQEYLRDKQAIDINIHYLFVQTVRKIDAFFRHENSISDLERKMLDEAIINFYQAHSVKKEVEAAHLIMSLLEKNEEYNKSNKDDFMISGKKM